MLTILSPRDPRLSARLRNVAAGVEVSFWRAVPGGVYSGRRYPPTDTLVDRQTVDAPWHLARDLAHDLMAQGAVR